MLLDPYIVALGEDLIDFADFESRYHAIFSDELIFEEKQKVNGSNQIIRGIRGIPVGFEPMGMYYNRDMLSGVPTYWADIMDQLTEETKTSGLPAFSLGYGRATPYSADILAIRTMQYEGADFSTYAQIDTVESRGMIEKYLDFRRAPNNMSQYEDILKNTRTATDLFTRGKVATLIGYPSTVKDIQLAEKRAKKDKELVESFADNIRWTTIPQVSDDPKEQLNLGRYMYFALAKYGTNRNPDKPGDDPAIKFLQFLNTEKAQKTFFNNHTYYLPSQLSLLTEEAKTQIDGDNGPGMTV